MRTSLALLMLAAIGFADDSELTAVDRKVMPALTERKETKQFVFHYEPDLPKSKLKKAMALNRRFFNTLEKKLRMRYRGQIHLFLHSSQPRLRELTGEHAQTGDS